MLQNLPVPAEGNVTAKVVNHEALILSPSGYIVKRISMRCVLDEQVEQFIANEIAQAINEARDAGFEQGRTYVRRAIGM